MPRGPSGRWKQIGAGSARFTAFVPSPLPPDPPLRIEGALLDRLVLASTAVGRLGSLTTLLPDPDLFLYSYVRREAVLSSQIEGTKSTLNELLLFELAEAPGAPVDEVVEVSNYVKAMERGLELLRGGLPLCNRLACEVHGVLLTRGGGADKLPGKFRTSQVWIGCTHPATASFVPPPEGEVERCMADWERFLNVGAGGLPPLVRTGLAHAQFETIHPFLDGNGRVGRMLIALGMCQQGLMRDPLLYLSLYFRAHRNRYFELLDRTRSHGAWEDWLEFFLTAVQLTADAATDAAQRLMKRFEADQLHIQQLGRVASRSLRVFAEFKKRPVLSATSAATRSHQTYPTANKALSDLERLGIVQELTGGFYGRAFGYSGYLEILNEEPDWIAQDSVR
jgi:Fic family protein